MIKKKKTQNVDNMQEYIKHSKYNSSWMKQIFMYKFNFLDRVQTNKNVNLHKNPLSNCNYYNFEKRNCRDAINLGSF